MPLNAFSKGWKVLKSSPFTDEEEDAYDWMEDSYDADNHQVYAGDDKTLIEDIANEFLEAAWPEVQEMDIRGIMENMVHDFPYHFPPEKGLKPSVQDIERGRRLAISLIHDAMIQTSQGELDGGRWD